MRRIFVCVFIFCLAVIHLTGCASFRNFTHPAVKADNMVIPPYSGPKARIAVVDFEVKASKATSDGATALHQMLVETLKNSNRFLVSERQDLPPDLIITAAITEFEPQASGGSAGIGGGGGAGSGMMGGLLGASPNKAHMSLEIRIADAATSEVLASTKIQGQATDTGGISNAGGELGQGLSAYLNTPMEKAIRVCIIETVRYLAQTTPEKFYQYQ